MNGLKWVAALLVMVLVTGCQTTPEQPEEMAADDEAVASGGGVEADDDDEAGEPGLVAPADHSEELMDEIVDYETWEFHAGIDTQTPSGHPGDVWVVAYANELGVQMVEDQQVPAPAGTIFVKEEYDGEDAANPFAVTVMEKLSDEEGDWYWMKSDPDLQGIVEGPEGMALEGTEDLGCINCHGAAAHQDYVMAPQF